MMNLGIILSLFRSHLFPLIRCLPTSHSISYSFSEIGTIMRYLGAFPSEEEIVSQILPSLQDETDLHNVKLSAFEPFMVRVIAEKLFEPDSEEVLMQAFRTLFPDKPFAEESTMAEYLKQGLYGFRDQEVDDFMRVAKNDQGLIYFEEYVAHLLRNTQGTT